MGSEATRHSLPASLTFSSFFPSPFFLHLTVPEGIGMSFLFFGFLPFFFLSFLQFFFSAQVARHVFEDALEDCSPTVLSFPSFNSESLSPPLARAFAIDDGVQTPCVFSFAPDEGRTSRTGSVDRRINFRRGIFAAFLHHFLLPLSLDLELNLRRQ